ncbi:MAG: hypothetical protein IJ725_03105 [Ruminococcus sp.]|nr:hypothetical protein [Ruminococcus sp.]
MKLKLIIPIIIALLLTSCTQVIVDEADEIRLNKWCAKLENESEVSLSFDDNTACFRIDSKDKDAETEIKGLSVIDNKNIMIYNESESEPYFFEYKIKNNTLTLKYSGGSLTLTR